MLHLAPCICLCVHHHGIFIGPNFWHERVDGRKVIEGIVRGPPFVDLKVSRITVVVQGDFFHWYPPKKYGKHRLGESTLT